MWEKLYSRLKKNEYTDRMEISVDKYFHELCLVTQSCLTLVTPWTVAHQAPLSMGILQARILEWVAIPSSKASSQPRDQAQVSDIAVVSLPTESPGKPRVKFS